MSEATDPKRDRLERRIDHTRRKVAAQAQILDSQKRELVALEAALVDYDAKKAAAEAQAQERLKEKAEAEARAALPPG